MKQLPFGSAGFATPLFALFTTISIMMFWTSEASAYEKYSGCKDCHGGFRSSPYISLSDGSNWGNDLHDVHRNDMLSGDCDACHNSSGRSQVFLASSKGGSGLTSIGCVGCHGREQDMGHDSISAGRGAGLRQHHTNAGETGCRSCHSDANPANYTPVGENVLPNYFANEGTGHPSMPTDSCNPSGGENFAGTTQGLDNDGDGSYDKADSDCSTVVVTYSIGGNVSGLTGSGLALKNNGTDTLAVTANGSFTFATKLEGGSAYAVTVSAQPSNQTCSVSNGSGAVAAADITNVAVSCVTNVVPTYSIGGNVSGLTGSGLALKNNGTDTLAVTANGSFKFVTKLAGGSAYAVTVSAQPTNQTCSVSNASGTVAAADITNVAVSCADIPLTSIEINTGLNDAWYDPLTDGQGFFITVYPELGTVALAWFTYDTELPPVDATSNLGDPGHRWVTASGPFADNQAVLNIVLTSGGIFDTASEVQRTDPVGSDGTLILTFGSCNSGTVEYDIPSIDRQGTVSITRVEDENVVLCEELTDD